MEPYIVGLNILENYKLDGFNFYLGCPFFVFTNEYPSNLRKNCFKCVLLFLDISSDVALCINH